MEKYCILYCFQHHKNEWKLFYIRLNVNVLVLLLYLLLIINCEYNKRMLIKNNKCFKKLKKKKRRMFHYDRDLND